MVTQEQLLQLLNHRGSIFYVSEKLIPGNDFKCPNCNGKGTVEVGKSDCGYDSWTETQTCGSCNGTKRASKKFQVEEVRIWQFTVSHSGIEPDYWLREKQIFITRPEAEAEVARLTSAAKTPKRKKR